MEQAGIQLPKYKCHKEVYAAKIQRIERESTGHRIFMSVKDHGDASVFVTQAWLDKFNPQVDGYFVQYEDGYTSYSPADVFEAGYTIIGKPSTDLHAAPRKKSE